MLRFTLRGSKFKKNLGGGLQRPPYPQLMYTRFARNSLRSLVPLPLYLRLFGSPLLKNPGSAVVDHWFGSPSGNLNNILT